MRGLGLPEAGAGLVSLEDDLAALEATDSTVRRAAEQLDEATTVILSTSAQLRETRQALAASQADLSRMERERDELTAKWEREFERVTAERDNAKAAARRWHERFNEADESEEKALERWRAEVRRRDLARAELASARQELEQLRALNTTKET